MQVSFFYFFFLLRVGLILFLVTTWRSCFYNSCVLTKEYPRIPTSLTRTIVKAGFKLLCTIHSMTVRCGSRSVVQALKPDLTLLKEFLSIFYREPHDEVRESEEDGNEGEEKVKRK